MIVLGIDPGLKGGLAALTRDGVLVLTTPMPVTKGGGSKSEIDVPAACVHSAGPRC